MVISLMMNKTLVDWMSKHQATVKTAIYGSEIIVMQLAVDQIIEWRYSMHILGVLLADNGCCCIFLATTRELLIPQLFLNINLKNRHHALLVIMSERLLLQRLCNTIISMTMIIQLMY